MKTAAASVDRPVARVDAAVLLVVTMYDSTCVVSVVG